MSTFEINSERPVQAADARASRDALYVRLQDGSTVSAPLPYFPRLHYASPRARRNWELTADGEGIHWPELDEDILVEHLANGGFSGEGGVTFNRWLQERSEYATKVMRALSSQRVTFRGNPALADAVFWQTTIREWEQTDAADSSRLRAASRRLQVALNFLGDRQRSFVDGLKRDLASLQCRDWGAPEGSGGDALLGEICEFFRRGKLDDLLDYLRRHENQLTRLTVTATRATAWMKLGQDDVVLSFVAELMRMHPEVFYFQRLWLVACSATNRLADALPVVESIIHRPSSSGAELFSAASVLFDYALRCSDDERDAAWRRVVEIELRAMSASEEIGAVLPDAVPLLLRMFAALGRDVTFNELEDNGRLMLGMAYEALGRSQEARHVYDEVLEENPDNEIALQLKTSLDAEEHSERNGQMTARFWWAREHFRHDAA